ncbi:MAG: CdaR family protein [Myxococcota bacterium]
MADRFAEWATWLTANPFTKGLAALIAVTAWLFVQQDVARESTVPVRLQWQLPSEIVAVEPLRQQVVLRVEGPRAATKRAQANGMTLPVDLTGYPAGQHLVDLTGLDWTAVPASLTVMAVEPPTLSIDLDALDRNKVPVEARHVGDPALAYGIRGVMITPPVVELVGPRRVVKRLDRVFTEPIEVTAMTGPTTVDAALDLPWGVSAGSGTVVQATVDVEVLTATVDDLTIPVIVYDDHGWVPEPREITVSLRGPAPQLTWIGESSVVAFVRLPRGAQNGLEARYGAQRGASIEIWHPGGPEVSVTRVQPSLVRVERR